MKVRICLKTLRRVHPEILGEQLLPLLPRRSPPWCRAMLGVTIPNFGQSKTILLQVPPGNNVDSDYKLRVEGAGRGGGAIIFENETMLEFSRQFLSVSISTNRAIYSGTQKIEIRAIMLTTALQPYTGIADLFIIGKSATTLPSMMNAKLTHKK